MNSGFMNSNFMNSIEKSRFAAFCDFDGTVAHRDVGYHLYRHFSNGKSLELLPDWKAGRISTRECLRREAEMFRGTPEEFYAFLEQFDINPGFDQFAHTCRDNGIDLFILSDGLDIYIEHLLQKHGIDDIPFICNRGRLENGRLAIEFPYPEPEGSGEGVGKGERIAEYRRDRSEGIEVIFVGDGLSDVGAMRQADIVFAKKDLSQYCDQRNIAYTSFDTFFDVTAQLTARSIFTH